MRRACLLLMAWIAGSSAQPRLAPPRLGVMRDRAGRLRPLDGVAANFILGPPWADEVEAAASCGAFTLYKTAREVIAANLQGAALAIRPAPPGPARFAFAPDGSPALAWLDRTGELLRWQDGQFSPVPTDWQGGEMLALAVEPDSRAVALLRRESSLWLATFSPATGRRVEQRPVPFIAEPVLLLAGGTLLHARGCELVMRKADGGVERLRLRSPALRLAALADGWVHVATFAADFALRLENGRAELFALPEPAP